MILGVRCGRIVLRLVDKNGKHYEEYTITASQYYEQKLNIEAYGIALVPQVIYCDADFVWLGNNFCYKRVIDERAVAIGYDYQRGPLYP